MPKNKAPERLVVTIHEWINHNVAKATFGDAWNPWVSTDPATKSCKVRYYARVQYPYEGKELWFTRKMLLELYGPRAYAELSDAGWLRLTPVTLDAVRCAAQLVWGEGPTIAGSWKNYLPQELEILKKSML